MKGLVVSVANHLGIFDTYAFIRRRLMKSQVAILMYHRISPKRERPYLNVISVKSFRRQIEYIFRNYEILSLDELVEYILSEKPLPKKAVVITFDDGYKDNYLYAYPILQKYHIPATIFLVTGHIGTDKLFWWDKIGYILYHTSVNQLDLEGLGSYSLESEPDKARAKSIITEELKKLPDKRKNSLVEKLLDVCQMEIPRNLGRRLILSWEEVREMSDEKLTFGAHSVNHPVLTKMPIDQAKNEIVRSKKAIEERLGKEVRAFCYPDGKFNPEIVELVKKSGFNSAVSILTGRLISLKDSVYQLNRIRAREDFNKFKGLLCGLRGDLQGYVRV